MRRQFIVRGTPTLGMVSASWARAMEEVIWPMNVGRAPLYVRDNVGGEIAETRNQIVQTALAFENAEREAAAFFWLDDDVVAMPGVLMQLLSHQTDIVSGVYFRKHDFSQAIILAGYGSGTIPYDPAPDGEQRSIRTWMGSMGLSLVKADVYRRMRDELKLPKDKYGCPEWYKTTAGQFVTKGDSADCGGTEDSYFMRNAQQLGYECVVDLTRHAFGFHYDSTTHTAYPKEQWSQFLKREPIRWPNGSVWR